MEIEFITPYNSVPNVVATISDGTLNFVSISTISTTNFTAITWGLEGFVSAQFNWQAIL